MTQKIKIKRGLKSNLPTLDVAEFGYCIDTHETFIGSDNGNILFAKKSDIPTFGGSGLGTSSYLIELDRWGIIQGLPNKPYTNQNYTTANNNITGINNALVWAKDNNYNHVILPKGEYSICYPNPIVTQANMTIDFNFSTLKVMYDSDVRSPYDISTNPVYEFAGTSILVTTPYTHIINLKLIGDRIDRSWSNSTERSMESTVGIKLGSGSNRSSVRNCNISYYMGDAIYLSYSPYENFDFGNMELGGLDNSGNTTTGTTVNTLRTIDFVTLPSGINSLSMIGLGYHPQTSIPSGMYNIYFYKSDNTFIIKKNNVRTRDLVILPKNAVKIKLTFEGNGTLDDDCLPDNPPYWAILLKNGLSDNAIIEYNEIHRCHRGGIFLGNNNVLIRKNYFHDTGSADGQDIDGLPQFTDFTRYAINTEDNIGHNCKIIDNVFDNVRMAIALRGDFNEISSNEFRNCVYGTILYHLKNCLIDKNYFHYSAFGNYEYTNFDRNWVLSNNVFVGDTSVVNLTGSGSTTAIANNHFVDGASFVSTVKVLSFKNNNFNNATLTLGGNEYINTLIDGCSFTNNGAIKVTSVTNVLDNIIRCSFINSYISGQNSKQVIIRDSTFKESGFKYSTGTVTYSLNNCKVENTNRPVIKSDAPNDIGTVAHVLEIKDSNISLGSSIISSIDWGKLIINRSIINYNISSDLTTALLSTSGNIKDTLEIKNSSIVSSTANASHSINGITNVTLVDNTFTNFSLLNASATIKRFDSTVPYIRVPDTGTATPTSTPQYIGQTYIDTVAKKIYQAVGTSSSSDWIILN